jgi:hypothetical protein
MIARTDNWESDLAVFVEARARTPFRWGGNDCVSFALRAVEAMTGRVVWEHPQCPDAMRAERFLRRQGGLESLIERIAGNAGWREVENPERQCSRGDIALFTNARRLCVGIVGIGRVLCPGSEGLKAERMDAIKRGWHLPFNRKEEA